IQTLKIKNFNYNMLPNHKITIALLFCLGLISACSSSQKKLSEEIKAKEKSLDADSTMVPDPAKAKEIIALYTKYATEYSDDTLSASYLFKAGDISSKINE